MPSCGKGFSGKNLTEMGTSPKWKLLVMMVAMVAGSATVNAETCNNEPDAKCIPGSNAENADVGDESILLQTRVAVDEHLKRDHKAMGQADSKVMALLMGQADDKALGQAHAKATAQANDKATAQADDEAAAVDEEEETDKSKDLYVYEELERAKATKKHSKKGPKLMTFINEHIKRSCQQPSDAISLLEYNNLKDQIEEELRRHSGKIPENCQSFQTASQDAPPQQNKDENNEDWKPKYDLLLQCCEAFEKQKLEEEVETYGVDVVGPSGVVYDYLQACSKECNDLKEGCTGFVDEHSARNLLNPRECLLVEEEEEEDDEEPVEEQQLASLQDDLKEDQAPGPMIDFWKKQQHKVLSFAAANGPSGSNSFSSKGSAQNCKKITHKNKAKQKKLIKQCKAAKNK